MVRRMVGRSQLLISAPLSASRSFSHCCTVMLVAPSTAALPAPPCSERSELSSSSEGTAALDTTTAAAQQQLDAPLDEHQQPGSADAACGSSTCAVALGVQQRDESQPSARRARAAQSTSDRSVSTRAACSFATAEAPAGGGEAISEDAPPVVCVSLVELQERDARMFARETSAPVASGRGAAMRYATKELVQLVWKVAQAPIAALPLADRPQRSAWERFFESPP